VARFIGSNLLQTLLKLEQRVVGLDNFSTGRWQDLEEIRGQVALSQRERFRLVRRGYYRSGRPFAARPISKTSSRPICWLPPVPDPTRSTTYIILVGRAHDAEPTLPTSANRPSPEGAGPARADPALSRFLSGRRPPLAFLWPKRARQANTNSQQARRHTIPGLPQMQWASRARCGNLRIPLADQHSHGVPQITQGLLSAALFPCT